MNRRYPLHLKLQRCAVLVVGGGAVATRKVAGLVDAGGFPAVIAPRITERLAGLVERCGLRWERRVFRAGDTTGQRLVFAATDDRRVNAVVAREANEVGAWVNVADDPEESSVQVPSVLREGRMAVSLGTGGASPLLARLLRERLAETVTPGLARAADRLAGLRSDVRAAWPDDEARRRDFWHELVTPALLDAAIAGRDNDVDRMIGRCLSQS